MADDVSKVVAYVTRRRAPCALELLVHDHRDHPEAGTQVPAGTVEPGESLDHAVERELFEESGLVLKPVRLLRVYRWFNEHTCRWNLRHVYHFHAPDDLADTWDHTITGHGEDRDLVFRYRWLSLDEAERQLFGDLGGTISHLQSTPTSKPSKETSSPIEDR